jgi:hypothetical protein
LNEIDNVRDGGTLFISTQCNLVAAPQIHGMEAMCGQIETFDELLSRPVNVRAKGNIDFLVSLGFGNEQEFSLK